MNAARAPTLRREVMISADAVTTMATQAAARCPMLQEAQGSLVSWWCPPGAEAASDVGAVWASAACASRPCRSNTAPASIGSASNIHSVRRVLTISVTLTAPFGVRFALSTFEVAAR